MTHEVALNFADESSIVQTRFPTTALVLLRTSLGEDVRQAIADSPHRGPRYGYLSPRNGFEHFVYLGSGWTVGLAHEAALKMREAAQAWSEVLSGDGLPARADRRRRPPQPGVDVRHAAIRACRGRAVQTGATVVTGDLDPLAQLIQTQRCAVTVAAAAVVSMPTDPRGLTRSVVLTP